MWFMTWIIWFGYEKVWCSYRGSNFHTRKRKSDFVEDAFGYIHENDDEALNFMSFGYGNKFTQLFE